MKSAVKRPSVKELSILLLCTCRLLFQGFIWHSECASLHFRSVPACFIPNLQVCVAKRENVGMMKARERPEKPKTNVDVCYIYKAIKMVPVETSFYL